MYKFIIPSSSYTTKVTNLVHKTDLVHKAVGLLLTLIFFESTFAQTTPPSSNNFQASQTKSDAQTQSEVEQQHKDAEGQAQDAIIREAVEAIEDTKKAIAALNKAQEAEALTAIKKATGNVDILLARYPEDALLPVSFEIEVIDIAPLKIEHIKEITLNAGKAMSHKNYPDARLLLHILRSEIITRTFNLPLGIYPAALKEAAHLLEQKKVDESKAVLITALNTLVIVNKVIPIPIIKTKALITIAEEKCESDKETALKLVNKAQYELERTEELGYASHLIEYKALKTAIKELEHQIKSDKKNLSGFFSSLKDKLGNLLKRHSEAKKPDYVSQKS